ncbi:mucin-5AC-like isoform X1 [Corvus hawaiiensis]|uniref:mucin-5AC-like isoform X1 n=1 Tax=Corvus hawaiiensis TaxID=134902 RepID=UPI002018B9D8|nr:mucin-5AC-like isoform X1 [Corvus hawaiiensis]
MSSPAPSTPSTNPVASTSGTPSEGSSAVTPSPQQSSTSGTTETPLAASSHPPTAFVFSSAGVTGVESGAVTAEEVTPSPALSTASTNPVASAPITSPASGITESIHSPTLSSSTETPAPRHTSTLLTQGHTTVEVTATSSPMGSPLSSITTAPGGSSATTPPGEGESSTMNQGNRTTAEPTAKTSHSLSSTTLGSPSTTNHSISTSVNPSFTGTCSPITLSIQLQEVTSTMIQFSWEPQGGTGDSPYTVRLLGKSGEMKKKILNGTSTVFENLLSGHQYQISVDVSTCSKNVSTSLTVQTAAEVYSGTTRITSEDFKPAYQNKSSREFMEFENKFITEITKHLPQKLQELKNGTKMRIVINSITEGSVIVLFDIVLDVEQNITKPEVSDAFTEALNRSTEFEVDLRKTVVEARNSCQPGLNDCDQNATCTAEGATYSCGCNKGFTDKSPQVPGRVCQQDLPSQQTTPVPPDTNTTKTTGFTGSTSNSIFTTTFTSAPCMPVSVEVQNVTAEEIQLSWTSGSKGSLYNISVRDGSQEIYKTTTEETKAVFKHLLPGHVYIISVAVSSCAEKNQTSVTVQTDSASCFEMTEFCLAESTGCSELKGMACSKNQAFACSVVLKSQIFNNTLYNSESEHYKTLSGKITTDVVRDMRAELNNDRFNIVVLGFRPGSVVVDFLSLLPKEEPVDVYFIWTSLTKIIRNEFGNQTKVMVQPLSVQPSTDNYSSWRVAVIVLGVLLGVALVLILLAILFYIYVRRRSGKYLVEPSGLMGMFVYKHF